MFQATFDLGISVFFSSDRMCMCNGDFAGPYTSLTPFKAFFLESAYGWKDSQTLRRKSFCLSELCLGLVFLGKTLHYFVWIEDPSQQGETQET